jgi:hypothetical protein
MTALGYALKSGERSPLGSLFNATCSCAAAEDQHATCTTPIPSGHIAGVGPNRSQALADSGPHEL